MDCARAGPLCKGPVIECANTICCFREGRAPGRISAADSVGRAVPTSARGAVAGLKSSAQRDGIRAVRRLSRSVLRMVFLHSPLANLPAPLRRRTRHAPGGSAVVALCPHDSRLGRAIFGKTVMSC